MSAAAVVFNVALIGTGVVLAVQLIAGAWPRIRSRSRADAHARPGLAVAVILWMALLVYVWPTEPGGSDRPWSLLAVVVTAMVAHTAIHVLLARTSREPANTVDPSPDAAPEPEEAR